MTEQWVFLNADYDGLELRTIAQKCIWIVGYSNLGEALNAGKDPHIILAANRIGLDYDAAIKLHKQEKAKGLDSEDKETFLYQRQMAKMGNFGFDGGLGPVGFVFHARDNFHVTVCADPDHNRERRPVAKNSTTTVCELCFQIACTLREDWLDTWPEEREFQQWVKVLLGREGVTTVQHFGSNRYRGHIPYTVTCNTFSQGLGADATKAALYALSKACYVPQPKKPDAWLFGSYPVDYIHDEFIIEALLDEWAHDKAHAMADIMVREANKWLPDVPTTATPLLMARWSKNAQPVHDDNGRLIPWDCEVDV